MNGFAEFPLSRPTRTFTMAFPILRYLAVNPRKTAYEIAKKAKIPMTKTKKTEIDIPTTYSTMKLLDQAKLVRTHDAGRYNTGLMKKTYDITPQGIVALLQGDPDHIKPSKEYVRNLAQQQASFLPLIFGKWEYFREQGVEDLAYKYLLISVTRTEDEVDRLSDVASGQELKRSWGSEESMHRHDLYEGMLVHASQFGTDEAEKWGRVIKNDKELSLKAEKEIGRLRAEVQEEVEDLDGALKDLHGEKNDAEIFVAETSEEGGLFQGHEEWCRYMRATALDEEKPLPRNIELTGQVMEMMFREEGVRVPKKASRKSKI